MIKCWWLWWVSRCYLYVAMTELKVNVGYVGRRGVLLIRAGEEIGSRERGGQGTGEQDRRDDVLPIPVSRSLPNRTRQTNGPRTVGDWRLAGKKMRGVGDGEPIGLGESGTWCRGDEGPRVESVPVMAYA